jgi:repressor LexA
LQALTARQQQILEFIHRYSDKAGMPPTRAEIAAFMGFRSVNAAEDHLKALARKGAISLTRGTSRGIRLNTGVHAPGRLPVVGNVAAGAPILAQEHISDQLDIAPDTFRPRADYLLQVRGTSMRDAGILDGDLLAVHQSREAGNGQIVVARVNDEVTVKRFNRRGSTVRLQSANPDFDTIVVDLGTDDFAIEGLGVGIVRDGLARSRKQRSQTG